MRRPAYAFAAVIGCAALLLGPAHALWPLEDSTWSYQAVNTSSLCTDPASEDIDPDDPAIRLYSRRAHQHAASLQQRVHLVLGRYPVVDDRFEAAHAAAMEQLLRYNLLLSEDMLARGLSNVGDTRRMERFLHKLLSGEAVTMVALGGSITAGHGVSIAEDSYIARLYGWVQATFPHEGHRLLNRAVPGTTSSYISPCVLQMVPPEADFVLLEFTFNDAERAAAHQAPHDDPTRRGFERLVRKMLSLPSRPAVAYFHVWVPHRLGFLFYDSPEDRIDMVPKYYGLPSLSMRNAMYHAVADRAVPQEWLWRGDNTHANCLGHRFMADLLIGYLQNMGLHALASSAGQPQPHEAAAQRPLPQPAIPGNWETHASHCRMDGEFRGLVSQAEGWVWVDEGKTPLHPKWGYVTEQMGASMLVQVPTEGFLPVPGEPVDEAPLTIGISALMSYARTGAVRLECELGCLCEPREYSLHILADVSLMYWKPLLEVQLPNNSAACTVRVTNPVRDSDATKLKVSGVMMTREAFMVSHFDWEKAEQAAAAAAAAATEGAPVGLQAAEEATGEAAAAAAAAPEGAPAELQAADEAVAEAAAAAALKSGAAEQLRAQEAATDAASAASKSGAAGQLQAQEAASDAAPAAGVDTVPAEQLLAQQAATEAAPAALEGVDVEQQPQEAAAEAAHAAEGDIAEQEGPWPTAQGRNVELELPGTAARRSSRPLGVDAGGLLALIGRWGGMSGWYVAAPGWGLAALLLLRAGWGAAR